MRRLAALILLTLGLLLSSCQDHEFQGIERYIVLHGSVTDTEGTPLEHIRIKINSGYIDKPLTIYTDSNGEFHCELEYLRGKSQLLLYLTFDDVDGEENNGHYASRQENISIFLEDYDEATIVLDLKPYRLNLATV